MTRSPTRPLADLRHEFYNMALQRKIDDVNATTGNRTQMITGILWTCVEWLTAVATIPFPPLSLSLGGLLAFKDAMLALNAYQQRDKGMALQHFLGYLLNSGGALLFDYRQVLKGTFNLLSPLRPLIPASKQALKTAALKPLKSTVPPGLQPALFDGQTLWAAQKPDALGRHLLYRLDASTGEYRSTARLVSQDAKGRWTRSGMAGGGRTRYEKLPEDAENPLAPYEIARDQSKNLRTVLAPDFLKEQTDWGSGLDFAARASASTALAPLKEAYPAQVQRLSADAEAFFQALGPRPARPAKPTFAPDAAHADILQNLFTPQKRLIIGAHNNSIASKQLLIENMPALAEKGLKRLYIENLPADIFRSKLQVLNKQVKGDIARALKQVEAHLANVDVALGLHRQAPFSYRQLMLSAHRHNVAVEGLDGSASYHLEQVLALGKASALSPAPASSGTSIPTKSWSATRRMGGSRWSSKIALAPMSKWQAWPTCRTPWPCASRTQLRANRRASGPMQMSPPRRAVTTGWRCPPLITSSHNKVHRDCRRSGWWRRISMSSISRSISTRTSCK